MAKQSESEAAQARFGIRRMRPRDPLELFRASSPLELFFDLSFVVAVSLASGQLHLFEIEGHVGQGVTAYLLTFFGIWWAWMNFTWFASAFDTDDWPYRALVLVQMGGVIVLAVGATPAMVRGDYWIMIWGYVIMRLAMVAQWVRASRSAPELRGTAIRYAVGIATVQVLWLCFPLAPGGPSPGLFVLLACAELLVPVIAERKRMTPWHPGHIAERYGLFTLIVLGESVLAATSTLSSALEDHVHVAGIIEIGIGGFVMAACMWWLYFSGDIAQHLSSLRRALPFGYGHYAIFASAGAFSAGIAVILGLETGETRLGPVAAAATLTVPVAVYVFGVWILILRHCLSGVRTVILPIGALGIAACALVPMPLIAAAVVMLLLVVVVESSGVRVVAEREGADS